MPKILQINVTANWGSTGRIAEQIGQLAIDRGWESYIAYGRYCNPSKSQLIKIGNRFDVYEHYAENKLFDNEGLASRLATRRLVQKIKLIKPDIVHLHNIHDHYLNYPVLFDCLNEYGCPIVWTQHDCWVFTGGCNYFSMTKCEQWKSGCNSCPQKRGLIFDKTESQYRKKIVAVHQLRNLTLIPVSEWLAGELRQSHLKNYPIQPIYNGVDTYVFKNVDGKEVRNKYSIGDKSFVLGVAAVWDERKNLKDYLCLASTFQDINVVLVGLKKKQMECLPSNIIGIPSTQDARELAALYSEALAVLNLSLEETFGLTTVEGFACGTPAIVYNCTASPELITPETGRIVESGDIQGVYRAICELNTICKDSMSSACRQRALDKYDKDKCFEDYIRLYERLLMK